MTHEFSLDEFSLICQSVTGFLQKECGGDGHARVADESERVGTMPSRCNGFV